MSIYTYKAFPEVEDVFDIDEVKKGKVIHLDGGVTVSQPVPVKLALPKEGYSTRCALSPQGVLAVNTGLGGTFTTHFVNLCTDDRVAMETGNWADNAFFDNKVLVCQFDKPILEGDVEAIFEDPRVGTLTPVTVQPIHSARDIERVHITRRLYCRSMRTFYYYNVDEQQLVLAPMDKPKIVGSFIGTTGIDIGINTLFNTFSSKSTYVYKRDCTLSKVKVKHFKEIFPEFFLPSISEPENISKGRFLSDSGFIYKDRIICIKYFSAHDEIKYILRLMGDIFLIHIGKHWFLSRIIIE